MTCTPDTIRVFIPLTIRRRNGRPRILPPAETETVEGERKPRHDHELDEFDGQRRPRGFFHTDAAAFHRAIAVDHHDVVAIDPRQQQALAVGSNSSEQRVGVGFAAEPLERHHR